MAFTGSDGSEHKSQYDRDFNEVVNLGKEAKGGYGDLDKGQPLSGKDMERMGAFLRAIGPVVLGTIAMFGILAPFRVMLRDYYLIYISTSRLLLVSFIATAIISVPLLKFVIFPFMNGEAKVARVLLTGLIAVPGFLNGGFTMFGGINIVNSNLDTQWKKSFYSFDIARVSADRAVLRAATEANAKAVLSLERGGEFAIYGDAGQGWYFARERDIKRNIRNFGYVQADAVTLDDPGAKIQAMRPAALIVDNASIHRRRSWQSWQLAAANKNEYVLAVGKSRRGWTPVFKAGANGWAAGYINDALLFFDGGTGAKAPAEPKSVGETILNSNNVPFYLWGNERYRYTAMNLADQMRYRDNFPADRIELLPKGGRVILLEKQTKKQMAPAVYNGRMGWCGWLDVERMHSINVISE